MCWLHPCNTIVSHIVSFFRMAVRCSRSLDPLRWRPDICGAGELETSQHSTTLQGAVWQHHRPEYTPMPHSDLLIKNIEFNISRLNWTWDKVCAVLHCVYSAVNTLLSVAAVETFNSDVLYHSEGLVRPWETSWVWPPVLSLGSRWSNCGLGPTAQ